MIFDYLSLAISNADPALQVVIALLLIVRLGLYVANQYLDFRKRLDEMDD